MPIDIPIEFFMPLNVPIQKGLKGKRKYCKNHISLGNNDLRVQDEFRRNQKLLHFFT